jgi:hypothetical protein
MFTLVGDARNNVAIYKLCSHITSFFWLVIDVVKWHGKLSWVLSSTNSVNGKLITIWWKLQNINTIVQIAVVKISTWRLGY